MTQPAPIEKVRNTPSKPAKPAPTAGETAAGTPPGRILAVLTLLLAGAALGLGAWLWYQQQRINLEHNQQLTQLQKSLRALDEHPSVIELKQRVLDQGTRLDTDIASQSKQIDAVKQAFTATQRIANRDQRGWVLAEVEYLLRMAIVRLRLTMDVRGATEALKLADERLADLGDPAFLELREILAGEITALKVAAVPDIEGTALQLTSLSNQLYLLPSPKRPSTERLDGADQQADIGFWQRLLRRLGVRRSDAPIATAALYSELYYVEQLLQLELESAKRAVLELNKEKLNRHLLNARKLLEENYDRDNQQVIRLRADLVKLQESTPIPELPSIIGSLQKLRELQLRYEPATTPVEESK